jgi:predicted transglutaminase-like cysteine proteinase
LRDNGAVTGGAKGFRRGERVIVLRKFDGSRIYVIGHPTGIMNCTDDRVGNYYIFFNTGGTLTIAQADYIDGELKVRDMKNAIDVYAYDTTKPVTFYLKKFRHAVGNSPGIVQDLYFVATSLYINPAPFAGWTAFAAANPGHPLVTNNDNTQIEMTEQLMADMIDVNTAVNTACSYVSDWPNDNWRIMNLGDSGDCEDFALTKVALLLSLDYPVSALHIEAAMIDGQIYGHAWLVVQTTTGDYALDLGNNDPILNHQLHPAPPALGLDVDYVGRRRQIGSNWAFISPYGWLTLAVNQPNADVGATIWYILDPILNIFYLIDPFILRYVPCTLIANSHDVTVLSTTSINFSSDNTKIYVAENSVIRTLTLNQNSLDEISTSSYTSHGFVGRDGLIQLPENTYGRQDPGHFGGLHGEVYYGTYNSTGYLSAMDVARRGTFRSVYDCKVYSRDGYYEYEYQYLEGEFIGA